MSSRCIHYKHHTCVAITATDMDVYIRYEYVLVTLIKFYSNQCQVWP